VLTAVLALLSLDRYVGLADVRRAMADVEWLQPRQLRHGTRVYDLTR
jgi:hypothetical protein